MSQVCAEDWGASTSRPRPYYAQFDVESFKSEQRVVYRVEIKKGEDGWIIAKCLDVKGAISQGKTRDEALRNIVEAISTILEDSFGGKAAEFSVVWEEVRNA